jgi:hypothetical protein
VSRLLHAAGVLQRHLRYTGRVVAATFPDRTGRDFVNQAQFLAASTRIDIPGVPLQHLFKDTTITLRPETVLSGSVNIFDQTVLCGLLRLVKPMTVLEIGTFRGGTTWHLHENAPRGATVYTMDLPDDAMPDDITDSALARIKTRPFLPDSHRVVQIQIDSKTWDGSLPSKAQFVFIDGDHSYAGVKNDTEKALQCVDSAACIAWHDCLVRDFGYGTMRYLVGLRESGWKLFRVTSFCELSSIAVWMSGALTERLGIEIP